MESNRSITLTVPQLLFTMAETPETYLEMGRGSGKSTIIAWRIKEIVKHLPRAKFGIVGNTYQQLYTRTLPSTVEGLDLLGFKKDVHYVVGKQPPKAWNWLEPYQPPLRYDNFILFYNGTGFQLISLDNPDSSRGINLDGVLGDEAALLDLDKLSANVLLSNRGNIHRFNHWLHHSSLFASTTPLSKKGRWFTQQEEEALRNPKKVTYIIASSRYNLHNLGKEFFSMNQRILTPIMYNAEIECIRPGRVQTGFYPSFDPSRHTYHASNDNYVISSVDNLEALMGRIPDVDILPAPFDIACDYGAKINTLVVGQDHGSNKYRIPNSMFVKDPNGIVDLIEDFCKFYEHHTVKVINYYYDHTAVPRDAVRSTSFAEEVERVFNKYGWLVNMNYMGQAPRHDTKHLLINRILKEEEDNLPQIRMNAEKCKTLIVSIEHAGARDGKHGIEKDKRPERDAKAIDEETTHFSDAFDTLIYFKFKDGIAPSGYYV